MKRYYFGILFVSLFLGTTVVLAQDSTQSCSVVGLNNYDSCCSIANPADNTAACANYERGMRSICSTITSLSIYDMCCSSANLRYRGRTGPSCVVYENAQDAAGTVGSGGSPSTNPVNTGGGSGEVTATFGLAPNASSLNTCSDIRFTSLVDILIWLKCIIAAAIIPLIFSLAFVFFLWGMFQYIRNADNQAKREESKRFIYYGIIGLTVMVGVWGIVRIVSDTFGFGNTVPQLQTDCLTKSSKNPCK
jgi:hypothetical protein